MEWREMGRLAHEVGWEIEKRKRMSEEGRGGDGEMITLNGMKKNLEEEKKKVEEEKRMKEEAERRETEEKRKREESEEEKRKMEERIRNLEREVNEMKQLKEESFSVIKSLSQFTLHFSDSSKLTVHDNKITHLGSGSQETCVFTDMLNSVCIMSS